ncbi:Late embryogenesis abundant protein [Heracleum sosnowskyi]|uniref:Late embryogenesis abundant protein n=1 Tax=Heracleum sosnowskyi TaxID=360622 RepID=A0AAD8HWY4_9APIA|nr:Late embryogenesis abundant protein [Heracleum sosnowskyi]
MHEPHRSKPRCCHTNLSSCIVAFFFLLFIAATITTVYLLIFKPKHPQVSVTSVKFPTFALSNNSVNFTFFQYVTVTNPNRDTFTHYDSSLQLDYSGSPVGFVFIPAGNIDAGMTQHMSAKFSVEEFPVAATAGSRATTTAMEIETKMKLVGRVRVLKVLTHKVESGVKCRVAVQVSDGSVLGFHC